MTGRARPSRPVRNRTLGTLLLTLAVATAAGAAGPGAGLEPTGPPPSGVPATVAAAVAQEGLGLTLEGEAVWELWLRPELPAPETEPAFGQAFGALSRGGLVGVIRLPVAWSDYMGTRIGPGLYTLRYLVQPVDGAHMGVSLHRDFLLLVPAADDGGPEETYGFDELVALSRKATGTNHPAVLALFPVDGAEELPAVVDNELGQPTLAVQVGEVTLGLVVRGQGDV